MNMFTPPDPAIGKTRYGWTLIAFVLAGGLIAALVIWQLIVTSPNAFCAVAKATGERSAVCLPLLIEIVHVKDHAIVGLLTILGITVISVVAVALGVRISASGPGNTNVNIGADTTTVDNGDAHVSIPTPPSEEKK